MDSVMFSEFIETNLRDSDRIWRSWQCYSMLNANRAHNGQKSVTIKFWMMLYSETEHFCWCFCSKFYPWRVFLKNSTLLDVLYALSRSPNGSRRRESGQRPENPCAGLHKIETQKRHTANLRPNLQRIGIVWASPFRNLWPDCPNSEITCPQIHLLDHVPGIYLSRIAK